MRKLTLTITFLLATSLVFAQNGFALRGTGKGISIGNVEIDAARVGDNVRGKFATTVRTSNGALAIRGQIVRLAFDATQPHLLHFAADCKDANGNSYRVEGSCFDGVNPERDDIVFTVGNGNGVIYRGSTDRQVVNVRRIQR